MALDVGEVDGFITNQFSLGVRRVVANGGGAVPILHIRLHIAYATCVVEASVGVLCCYVVVGEHGER